MIFQKRAKKNSNLEFHIGKETIDIVHEYTYLGAHISSTGNFNISLEHLKELKLLQYCKYIIIVMQIKFMLLLLLLLLLWHQTILSGER